MAVPITPKRSSTAGVVPTLSQLIDGEMAINSADKVIYQRVGGVVVAVASVQDLALYARRDVDNNWTSKQTFNNGAAVPNDTFVEMGAGGAAAWGNSAGSLVLAASTSAASLIYLRPSGPQSTVGQVTLTQAGLLTAPNFAGALAGNASTATALQTARTINGTSFNGSTNITTANWGTARNLTIGATAKSVNGSANVAWSLAEIGAAAAGHTHALGDLSDVTLTSPVTGQALVFNGSVWANGTVGAGQYLPLSGGTVAGNLGVTGSLYARDVVYLGGGATNTADKLRVFNNGSAVRVDAVSADASAFKPLSFWATSYAFIAGNATFDGAVRVGGLSSFAGVFGNQVGLMARGWNNNITRWLDVMEADASLALYSYDTAGGTPTPVFNFKSPVAGGAALVSFSGAITSVGAYTSGGAVSTTGSGASLSFQDRSNAATKWDWYALGGVSRLWAQGSGDRLTVNTAGDVSTTGNVDAGGLLANVGRARLNVAEAGRSGYLALFRSTGQRAAYIGYVAAGSNRVQMQVEDGVVGWQVAGDMVHEGLTYMNSGINMYWANAGGYTRLPRIFVGGGDPGAASSDGDLWIV